MTPLVNAASRLSNATSEAAAAGWKLAESSVLAELTEAIRNYKVTLNKVHTVGQREAAYARLTAARSAVVALAEKMHPSGATRTTRGPK